MRQQKTQIIFHNSYVAGGNQLKIDLATNYSFRRQKRNATNYGEKVHACQKIFFNAFM